jgi:hypothetical protein
MFTFAVGNRSEGFNDQNGAFSNLALDNSGLRRSTPSPSKTAFGKVCMQNTIDNKTKKSYKFFLFLSHHSPADI